MSHLHLSLLHIRFDQRCHVVEGRLPGLPVQQDVVEDFEEVALKDHRKTWLGPGGHRCSSSVDTDTVLV